MDYLAKSNEKTTAGERVPVPPPEYLPVRGLAMWKKMPYDSKHPLQHRPRMDLTFKCKELGEPLYETYPNKDFELYQGPPPNTVYDSLHDPYLRFFFRSTHVFRNLLHRGLVTLDGRVKMKLPEFNAYRRYLFRLWVFHVNQLIRQEEEEETECYDQIFEAFEKRNPYFEDIFDNEEYFNVDTFLAQLTVRLYENEDINTRNPLIRSLIRWLQYEDRLQTNYGESYPIIRGWLRNQKRNKHMLEKKINMRRSQDNYLHARWESLKLNSKRTYEKVTRIQEKQRNKFQMLSARRLSRARKSWARSDPRNKKRTPRIQDNLTTKAPLDKKAIQYSKNIDLGEDWDDPTWYPEDFEDETEFSAELDGEDQQDEEILNYEQSTSRMTKKPPNRSANRQKKGKGFMPKREDFRHGQFRQKATQDRELDEDFDETYFQDEEIDETYFQDEEREAHNNKSFPKSERQRESNDYFDSHKRDDRYFNSESESAPRRGKHIISPYSAKPFNMKKGAGFPHKTNRPKADMSSKQTQRKADALHKPNKQKVGISYKLDDTSRNRQGKISPDSKNAKQLSRGIKSDKSSSSTQPRKMPGHKGKIPSVKSRMKEKRGSDTGTSESRSSEDAQGSPPEDKESETSMDKSHPSPESLDNSDLQDSRRTADHKSREGKRTQKSPIPGKSSSRESLETKRGVPEKTDGVPKSPLTQKGILEIMKSVEKEEVPPSKVTVPSKPDEDVGNVPDFDTSNQKTTVVLNKIESNIQRLDSYLNKEDIPKAEFDEASKHKIEPVQKRISKDNKQEKLHSSPQSGSN